MDGVVFQLPPLSPGLGDSRKYPYPTTGGMSILTPPPLPSEIPKLLTPPPLRKFSIFFFPDLLEFLFDCLKLLTNGKLELFPPAK